MDFWASLEHKLRYKKDIPEDEAEQLAIERQECAQISAALDTRMENIRNRMNSEEFRRKAAEQKERSIQSIAAGRPIPKLLENL